MGSSNFVIIIGISEAIKENKIFKTPTLFSVFYLSPLWRQFRFPILKESILPRMVETDPVVLEKKNVKSLLTEDIRRSEKITWTFGSNELKKHNLIKYLIK